MANEPYQIDIHQTVLQVLLPLPAVLAIELRNTIASLGSNQYPEGYRTVEGSADTYEITVGFFRVVYQVQQEQKRIKVAMVNLRIK